MPATGCGRSCRCGAGSARRSPAGPPRAAPASPRSGPGSPRPASGRWRNPGHAAHRRTGRDARPPPVRARRHRPGAAPPPERNPYRSAGHRFYATCAAVSVCPWRFRAIARRAAARCPCLSARHTPRSGQTALAASPDPHRQKRPRPDRRCRRCRAPRARSSPGSAGRAHATAADRRHHEARPRRRPSARARRACAPPRSPWAGKESGSASAFPGSAVLCRVFNESVAYSAFFIKTTRAAGGHSQPASARPMDSR